MKLTELIENCNLDQDQIDRYRAYQVIKKHYSVKELMDLIKIFLKGIGNQHTIPGNVIYILRGILDTYLNDFELTAKQEYYVIQNIINYWGQMDLMTRIELNL